MSRADHQSNEKTDSGANGEYLSYTHIFLPIGAIVSTYTMLQEVLEDQSGTHPQQPNWWKSGTGVGTRLTVLPRELRSAYLQLQQGRMRSRPSAAVVSPETARKTYIECPGR